MTARLDQEIARAMGELADAAPPARPFEQLADAEQPAHSSDQPADAAPPAAGALTTGSRVRWLAAAAAVVVVLGGVAALAALPSSPARAPSLTESGGAPDDDATVETGILPSTTGTATSASADTTVADGVAVTSPTLSGSGVDSAPATIPAPPGTTAASTSTLAPTAIIDRLAIGDAVMLGAATQLAGAGFTVDAQESRSFADVVPLVEQLAATERLGEVVVISAATNGPIGQRDLDTVLAALTEVDRVVLLTSNVERDDTGGNHALLYAAAAAHPNVEILDWGALAGSCPGQCFYDDGLHLRPDGQTYFAQLIADRAAG